MLLEQSCHLLPGAGRALVCGLKKEGKMMNSLNKGSNQGHQTKAKQPSVCPLPACQPNCRLLPCLKGQGPRPSTEQSMVGLPGHQWLSMSRVIKGHWLLSSESIKLGHQWPSVAISDSVNGHQSVCQSRSNQGVKGGKFGNVSECFCFCSCGVSCLASMRLGLLWPTMAYFDIEI